VSARDRRERASSAAHFRLTAGTALTEVAVSMLWLREMIIVI
jgi:hypothetical protein